MNKQIKRDIYLDRLIRRILFLWVCLKVDTKKEQRNFDRYEQVCNFRWPNLKIQTNGFDKITTLRVNMQACSQRKWSSWPAGDHDREYDGRGTQWVVSYEQTIYAIYTGDPADKETYTHIAVASIPIYGDERRHPTVGLDYLNVQSSGSSTNGSSWGNHLLDGVVNPIPKENYNGQVA